LGSPLNELSPRELGQYIEEERDIVLAEIPVGDRPDEVGLSWGALLPRGRADPRVEHGAGHPWDARLGRRTVTVTVATAIRWGVVRKFKATSPPAPTRSHKLGLARARATLSVIRTTIDRTEGR
jgi:hypothetical protein